MGPSTAPTPRIAVIVPCYNGGSDVLQAVASLHGQEAHQLVVVDDGSTDPETLRALDAARADGVSVVRQANAGVAAARRTALAHTSAEYVFALDADDLVFPGSLAALADHLDEHPEDALAWGDVIEFGARRAEHRRGVELDPWLITYMNFVPVAIMARRSALEQVGPWSAVNYEDWDLLMRFAERGLSGRNIRVPVQRYRIHHGGSMLSRQRSKHAEAMATLRRRHPTLFAARRANRRASRAPNTLKIALAVIGALPGLSEVARYGLVERAVNWTSPDHRWRHLTEPSRHPLVNALARRLRAVTGPTSDA